MFVLIEFNLVKFSFGFALFCFVDVNVHQNAESNGKLLKRKTSSYAWKLLGILAHLILVKSPFNFVGSHISLPNNQVHSFIHTNTHSASKLTMNLESYYYFII